MPAHFPKDEWALARFDGTPLYEHADPRRGEQPDWGTYVFDFGRTEVRNFLVANALYWLEEFHIDGLRVDAVASMLYLDYSRKDGEWYPNQYGGRENLEAVAFLQELNATVYKRVPGVTMIAEESTAWPGVTRPTFLGGLGFGFKWNMGWMHDTLEYISHEPIHRQYHHNEMTFSMVYAYSEHFILPISHDEVVHGKGSLVERMPGDRWQELANLRAFLGYMWAHPGKKLLFMGSEFAQSSEWSSERSLDWWLLQFPEHAGVLQAVTDLNAVYASTPALWQRDDEPAGFEWIDANDSGSNSFSWLRWDDDGGCVAVISNLSPVPREGYRLGLPFAGRWDEILNTDAAAYGGSGLGNFGAIEAEATSWHGRPASAQIILPPLSTSYFRFAAAPLECAEWPPRLDSNAPHEGRRLEERAGRDVRAFGTAGSSPASRKYSSTRARAASRSSPDVARTTSMPRANAAGQSLRSAAKSAASSPAAPAAGSSTPVRAGVQAHHGQSGSRVGIGGRGREHRLVGRPRSVPVPRLDRVVGRLEPRVDRRLDHLGLGDGALGRLGREGAGHALLSGDPQQLVEDLPDLRLRVGALEQRAPADRR